MEFITAGQAPEIAAKAESIRRSFSKQVSAWMRLCVFRAGEYLYREGDDSGDLLILLAGSCKVFKTLENGKNVLLCRYEKIEVLGEFELFGDPAAKTNVQALTDVYCMAFSVSEHRESLLSDNAFLRFVLREIGAKAGRSNLNLAINLMYPLEQRVAGYILTMQKNGAFSTNYTMLSEYLGCSLRHLLRTFRVLCEKEMLKKTESSYLIQDVVALEALAGNVYRQ
ncbi:cyclic nucleotide-binding domain-containing protein [Caproicibacter sp.]|uniref:cyclic nucleotide-binding domain-containing protein n=1 Tax=Caproicibacter sp. TaxID=2814884 RepID=UPI0039893905